MNTSLTIAQITAEEAGVKLSAIFTPRQISVVPRHVALMLSLDLSDEPLADVAQFYSLALSNPLGMANTIERLAHSKPRIAALIDRVRTRIT